MSVRQQKVQKMIKEELSLIFMNKLKDPAFSMVTITDVKVTPDLKLAKIYVSIYDRVLRDDIFLKILKIKKTIRATLAQKVKLRYVPELDFYVDKTMDYVEKMDNIFRQIKENDNEENPDS